MVKVAYLNVLDEDQYENEIVVSFMDNGDWEYVRFGFGKDNNGLYFVDLEDSGEDLREKVYVKKNLTLEKIVEFGLENGVFDKFDENDIRCEDDCEKEDWENFMKFIEA
jgi:hypothetical protein